MDTGPTQGSILRLPVVAFARRLPYEDRHLRRQGRCCGMTPERRRSADMIDREAGMEWTTGEDDARTWDVDQLRTVAAVCVVSERGAAVHRHRLMPAE